MASKSPIDIGAYIDLGFNLRGLRYTGTTACRHVITDITQAMENLDALKMTYPREQFQGFAKRLEKVVAKDGQNAKMPEREVDNLRSTVDCILETGHGQAKKRRLIRLASTSNAKKLRDFAAKGTLNQRQTYLFDETLLNLETGAYRSASVMGWNLAYDILRQWVYDDTARLGKFNSELQTLLIRKGSENSTMW